MAPPTSHPFPPHLHPPHLTATVLRVESLGAEQRVHLDGPPGAAWVARTSPAHPVTPGDTVHVTVAWDPHPPLRPGRQPHGNSARAHRNR